MADKYELIQFLVLEQLLRGEDDVICENYREICHIWRKPRVCSVNPRNIIKENSIKEGG